MGGTKVKDTKAGKAAEKRKEQYLNAFKNIASTKDGRLVLEWFMDHCGWKKPMLVVDLNTNTVIESSTAHNVAKRDVWFYARQFIPAKLLNMIESEKQKVEKESEE